MPADAEAVSQYLADRRGGPVAVRVPMRGPKRALLETVEHNARDAFVRHRLHRTSDHNSRARALEALQHDLDLPVAPLRIECYDMSHLQGTDYVGSMVVFEDGLPKKSDYRHFRVATVPGNDDYAAMEEVLTRRLTALLAEEQTQPAVASDGSVAPTRRRFAYPPQLILLDGGLGQLNVGVKVLASLGLTDRVPLASLAKSFEEIYRPGSSEPIRLNRQSDGLYLLQRLRDEAHRFAISYHRTLRGKRMTVGVLDGVGGLGPQAPDPAHRAVRGARRPPECLDRGAHGPIVVTGRGRVRCLRAAAHADGRRGTRRRRRGPRQEGGPMSEYLVVTGMSGAGRSTAGATLEDLGWFVIDNMPSALISKVAELVTGTGSEMGRVAFVVGRGGGDLDEVLPAVDALEAGRNRVRILFLDAADDVLIRRFEGTRRRHPQAARGVVDSISDERQLLSGLRDRADLVIDTGDLNTNQLRTRLMEVFGGDEPGSTMQTSILSFGFKHGVPLDVDLMFDCRFLPNPYWDEELRHHSGLEPEVRAFVLDRPETAAFLDKLDDLLSMLIPAYIKEGKSYLTVAMGCTGGRHRSVVLAEELARRLDDHGMPTTVFHRDVDR